ncbi:hypothetical protein DFQ28_011634 [Apophysomyces sp. BC1034]|nr:hypothetical protein DFQ30_008509 [Apophysomyces sp. BC1015]KAG0178603.1 hypothetical protein DFQ29_003236 [Apophysomyces sp. BC1021]KAG0191517.1 hypothetical protein DFQ28_011634 [Apophysomyces sp. BC1034]
MAVSSIYPLWGVYYFLTHPKQLWPKILLPIILMSGTTILSFYVSLHWLFPWHVHQLIASHWPSWISYFVSIITVILESAAFQLLCFAILVPYYQDELFDATLEARGLSDVFDHRVHVPYLVLCCRSVKSGVLSVFLLTIARLFVLIVTSPLNLIPVVGTILACYINAFPASWGQHIHYDLEFCGLKVSESYKLACRNKVNYLNFGAVAVALELVPGLNLLFMWTNIVGAALWIEDEFIKNEDKHQHDGEHSRLLRNNDAVEEDYGSSSA